MEKYLDKCLSSLLIPNIDDVELLVINDGSKDRSSEIAHSYADKYPDSIRVIDKENGNYGSCVNRGLKEATGKYVKILDADDYFDTTNFEKFVELLKKTEVDLLLTNFRMVDDNGNVIKDMSFTLSGDKILDFKIIPESNIWIPMHAVTYHRELFNKIDYRQTEGISYTDMEWVFSPIAYVNNIFYYDLNIYNYLVGREGQTVSLQAYEKNISHLIKVANALLKSYKELANNLRSENKEYLYITLKRHIKSIYKKALILFYPRIPENVIIDYDKMLMSHNSQLYEELDSEKTFFNFKYIKSWRTNKKYPLYFAIPFKIRKRLSKLKHLILK